VPLLLILGAIALAAVSGLPALLLPRGSPWGQRLSVLATVLSCAAGAAGAGLGLLAPPSASLLLPWPSVGDSLVGLDPLSAFFLLPVFVVGALSSIYGLGYWPAVRKPRTTGRLQIFTGLLVAGLALLVTARHGLAFLIGWEAMALSAFFLVSVEDDKIGRAHV
jgi:hydrogenase-4 component B